MIRGAGGWHRTVLVASCLILVACESAATPPTALGDLLAEAAGHDVELDPRLDAAAVAVAREVQRTRVLVEEGRGFTAGRTALWDEGISDPELELAVVLFDGELSTTSLRSALTGVEEPRRFSHAGFGVVTGDDRPGCAVILLTRRWADGLDASAWQPGQTVEARFTLDGELVEPRAWAIRPDGSADTLAVERVDEGYRMEVPASGARGWHRLEVVGRSGDRQQLVAIAAAEVEGSTPTVGDAARHLGRMVNRERERLGLEPLERLPALEDVARDHVQWLAGGKTFGHRSAGGLPNQRIGDAGIPVSVALENVARADSLALAQALIMASAEHRANLVHPGVTHVGMAAARSDSRAWYVVQEFVRWLPSVDLDLARGQAREAVATARKMRGKPRLDPKRVLDRIAQSWCERIASAARDELTDEEVRELTVEVEFHLDDVERVVAALARIDDVEQLARLPRIDTPGLDQYGLGLYQAPDGGMFVALVILVDRATERPPP